MGKTIESPGIAESFNLYRIALLILVTYIKCSTCPKRAGCEHLTSRHPEPVDSPRQA